MRTRHFLLVPIAAALAACGGDAPAGATAGLSDDLARDLALASAASVELTRAAGAEAVVSAEELTPRTIAAPAAPARRQQRAAPAPSPTPARIVTPAESDAIVAAPETVELAEDPGVLPEPIEAPVMAPRPRAPEVVQTSGPAYGGSRGPSWGDVIGIAGVVIRGGMGGIDDCLVHDARTSRGAMVNTRVPVPVISQPNIPSGSPDRVAAGSRGRHMGTPGMARGRSARGSWR